MARMETTNVGLNIADDAHIWTMTVLFFLIRLFIKFVPLLSRKGYFYFSIWKLIIVNTCEHGVKYSTAF